ncbi:TolC family protein [Persephonella sp.]
MSIFVFLCGLLLFSVVYGQTLEDIIHQHPRIKTLEEKLKAYRQKVEFESSLPDPVVSVSVKDIQLFYRPFDLGLEPMQAVELKIQQFLPIPEKRNTKKQIVLKMKDAYYYSLLEEKQALLFELYKTAYRLWETEEKLKIIQEYKSVAEDIIKLTNTLYAVGKASQSEVFDSQYFYSKLLQDEINLKKRKNKLLSSFRYLGVQNLTVPVSEPEQLKELSSYLSSIPSSPTYKKAEEELKTSTLKLKLAELGYKPDFAVFAGYSYRQEYPDFVSVGVSFNIPVWKKYRQDRAVLEANHKKTQAEHRLEEVKRRLTYSIEDTYYSAQASVENYRILKKLMLPQSQAVYRSLVSEYQVGKKDVFELLKSIKQILYTRIKIAEEKANYSIYIKRLEKLTGELR